MLSSFSLSNLKVKIDIRELLKRKDVLVFAGIIILALFIANGIYKGQLKKINSIKEQIVQEGERGILGNELAGLNAKISQKIGSYTKKEGKSIIAKLNEFARVANLRVLSITPGKEKDLGFYTLTSFKLNLRASYHNLGKFMSMVESQPGILKIEELNLRMSGSTSNDQPTSSGSESSDELSELGVNMVLSQTTIKAK